MYDFCILIPKYFFIDHFELLNTLKLFHDQIVHAMIIQSSFQNTAVLAKMQDVQKWSNWKNLVLI